MIMEKPAFLYNVFEAASVKIDYFVETCFAENMQWLKEIEDVARNAFGSASITLLPKTPSMKRKRPDVAKANEKGYSGCDDKHASTFVDGCKTKKLKIDDMSAIAENTLANSTTLDSAEKSMNRTFRQLRARKKKISTQPVKRSRRLAAKGDISYAESPIVIDTPEQHGKTLTMSLVVDNSTIVMHSPSPTHTVEKISPVSHVQPKVAALIEKLHLTAQKKSTQRNVHQIPQFLKIWMV